MARRIIVGVCCLIMVAATLAAPSLRAQTNSGLSLVTEFVLPGSNDTKFPHAAAANGRVHISGNVSRSDAMYWTKAANATSFPDPTPIGDAGGQPDYSNTSITVAANGTIYYAWDDGPSRTIYMRTIDTAGNLGPTRIVDSGSPFPIAVEIAVSSSNEIFVIWRNPDDGVRLRRSSDGGVSWTDRVRVTDEVVFASPLDLSAGPGGQIAMTYTAGVAGKLQVFVGLWNSATSSFVNQRVTGTDGDYADSSVTIAPSGKVFAAWRGVADSGGASGVFYAERQSDGSWPRSRIIGNKVTGTVNLNADEQGGLNLTWIGQPAAGNQLFYAYKPSIDTFRGPIASSNVDSIFNSHGAAGAGANGIYTHVVSELFSGSKLLTRYSLFQTQGGGYGATPVIEGGAATLGGKTTAQVTFTNPIGVSPATTQVRWRWNAPPTDTVNDSSGWQTYASTITVPIPPAILSSTACMQSTLYTQLRDTKAKLIEDPANKDTILIDGVVQALADAHNPFIDIADAVSGTASTDSLAAQLALSKGAASGGDPNYTRIPLLYLNTRDLGDCTGIASVAVGKSADAMEATYKTDAGAFNGLIPMPDLANLESGPRPVVVQVRDGAGSVRNFPFTITFDDTKPTLNLLTSGAPAASTPVSASPNVRSDILQNLTFTNLQVSDTQYGGRHFWGVWIANSRTPVADPLNDPSLKWKAVAAPGSGTSFTITDWSLGTGLSANQISAGTYYLYFRILDGAGNASDQFFSLQLTSNAQLIKSSLPFIGR